MEHTDVDISAINYGNRQLDNWLSHEKSFVRMIIHSEPMRVCMTNVFHTLVKFGELQPFDKINSSMFEDALQRSKEWDATSSGFKGVQLMKCILSLDKLAEKRLSVTIGT